MDIDEEMKKMEDEIKAEKQKNKNKKTTSSTYSPSVEKKKTNPLLEFLIGFVMLGGGIYWVLNSFVVSFSWGSIWSSFGMSPALSTGLMLIPLFVGIGIAFFMEKKALPGAVIALGVLIILITLLTSVRFRPLSASLWQYIVMFGMIAAGTGLLAKSLFKKSE